MNSIILTKLCIMLPTSLFKILFLITIAFFLSNCKETVHQKEETSSANNPIILNGIVLESPNGIQRDDVEMIANECSHIDFIFNDLPFSMNQSEKNAIIADLNQISPEAVASISSSCKPLARKIYSGNSEVLIESDLYFTDDCLYFVFIKDEKRLFANKVNQNGVDFYNKLLAQVQNRKK